MDQYLDISIDFLVTHLLKTELHKNTGVYVSGHLLSGESP